MEATLLAEAHVDGDRYTLEYFEAPENGKPYYVTAWGWTQGHRTLEEASDSLAYAIRSKIKYPFLGGEK